MPRFCHQCGAQVTETQRFCNKCGTQLQPTQAAAQPAQPAQPNYPNYEAPPSYQQPPSYGQMPYQQPYQQPYQSVGATAGDLKPNIAGALCYPLSFVTGILFLVLTPYNKDRFVRFHAFQAIFFFAAIFVLSLAAGILGTVLPWPVDRLLSQGVRVLSLVGTVWMIYQAYQGTKYKLPVVGDLAEQQADKM